MARWLHRSRNLHTACHVAAWPNLGVGDGYLQQTGCRVRAPQENNVQIEGVQRDCICEKTEVKHHKKCHLY